jgi:hypothetical protein
MGARNVLSRVRRFFKLERTVSIAVFAIVCWQLFIPPVLGLADNGDFARLLVYFDLTHPPSDRDNRYFGYLDRYYVRDAAQAIQYSPRGFVSSELAFIAGPVAVDRIIGKKSLDVIELGVVHSVAFAASVYFVLFASRAFAGKMRTIGVILGSIVFTDIAYIAYFNSFYGESATLIFFLIIAACAYASMAAERSRIAWLGAYFVAVTVFLLAKYQNIALLPVFLFFGGLVVKRWGEIKHFQAYFVFALAASYGGYMYFISSPDAVNDAVLYNSVFNGILVDSPTPGDDLAALGFPRELARYAGSTAFQPDSLRFNAQFLTKFRASMTIGKVFRFYLERPGRLFDAMNRTAKSAFRLRPKLGNYEKSTGRAPGSLSQSWAMWSSVRSALSPGNLWFVIAIGILYLGLLSRSWLRSQDRLSRLNLEWSALIAVMALAQLLLITVSDGILDLTKHAYLFNLLFDYMLVLMLTHLLASFMGTAVKPA